MNDLLKPWLERWHNPLGRLELAAMMTICLCAFAILVSIVVNFVECGRNQTKIQQRSIVATGTMSLFFVCFYLIIRLRMGELAAANLPVRVALIVAGLAIIVLGCGVNIAGRLKLGPNWANQVTIYEDQRLVTGGVYRLVRHPLYASLIWMFYGASLVYANVAAVLANTLVFVPFMVYRARQEEKLLLKEFKDYAAYQARVGMFF